MFNWKISHDIWLHEPDEIFYDIWWYLIIFHDISWFDMWYQQSQIQVSGQNSGPMVLHYGYR